MNTLNILPVDPSLDGALAESQTEAYEPSAILPATKGRLTGLMDLIECSDEGANYV